MTIQFCYAYRDYGNNKRFNSVVFSNPLNHELIYIDTIIRSHLIDENLFYATDWNLPDLHFGQWDEELDHELHEYEKVEEIAFSHNATINIDDFFKQIKISRNAWRV